MDEAEERAGVRRIGEAIGYGRVMQLCEELWGDSLERQGLPRGHSHSVGCAPAFLVPCPCLQRGGPACDWCCGSGRVTEKVRAAMASERVVGPDMSRRFDAFTAMLDEWGRIQQAARDVATTERDWLLLRDGEVLEFHAEPPVGPDESAPETITAHRVRFGPDRRIQVQVGCQGDWRDVDGGPAR